MPAPQEDRIASLLEEKSIWQLAYKTIRFKINPINTTIVILGCIVFSIYGLVRIRYGQSLGDAISTAANLAFNFSATILGFLIAGFTIFATMTDKNLFIKMLNTDHNTYGINYLKYTMIVFMDVFIQYIILILVSLPCIILGGKDGTNWSEEVMPASVSFVVYYVLISLLMVALSSLISFIYNVYNSIILSIIWHSQNGGRET